jgi:hypothetical protein
MIEDARLYHRFPINNPRLFLVSHGEKLLGFIQEISYGGFSLSPTQEKSTTIKKTSKTNPTVSRETLQLSFLDRTIQCQIEERYQSNDKIGYRFEHEQTEVLSFLKEIIPWIRAGAALGHLQKLETNGFEGELPDYLSFEGPIPIEVDWNGLDSKKIANFSITFKQDQVVYQLLKQNDELITKHNVWPGAESGELTPTRKLDEMICRSGLAILVGLATESQDPIFSEIIDKVIDLYQKAKTENHHWPQRKTG